MENKCYYCGGLKEVQRINSIKDNELKVGFQSKEPRKYLHVCKECIKRQGGIAKIAEGI